MLIYHFVGKGYNDRRSRCGRAGGPRRRPRIPDAGRAEGRGDPGRPRQGRPGDRRPGRGGDAGGARAASTPPCRARGRRGAQERTASSVTSESRSRSCATGCRILSVNCGYPPRTSRRSSRSRLSSPSSRRSGGRHSRRLTSVPPAGAAGQLGACAEGLAHPAPQKIRPIVFDHALAAGRDDVVLVHLTTASSRWACGCCGRRSGRSADKAAAPGRGPCRAEDALDTRRRGARPTGRDRRRRPPATRGDHHGRWSAPREDASAG